MTDARDWTGYAGAVAAVALCTLAGFAMQPRFDIVNIAMVYVLAVVLVAFRFGRGPTIAASVASVLAFDLVFVPPAGVLTISDLQYLFTFAVMVAIGLVVSGLRTSVQRREQAQAELKLAGETERLRNTLLASISHDLRTPLAVMAGASSSLAEHGAQMTDAERRALALGIHENATRMSDHVAKLLQMTRLESGTVAPERDWTSLQEIAGAALRRLEGPLGAHRVIVELPHDFPLLFVDAALVEQVLVNLLDNAARHTPAGTVVRLRAQQREGFAMVSVEDAGTGFDPAEAERIFAKFQHGASAPAVGGIGLGLAICRAIVQLHGGSMRAERLPEGGAAFRFTLPLAAVPAVPVESAAESSAESAAESPAQHERVT